MKILMMVLLIVSNSIALELTLGVVPQQSPLKLAKKWNKVSEFLYKESGIKVHFKTEKSIPKFENELYKGKYDIAYVNPYHFIEANKKQNYRAFTRAKKNIVGILLAKEKSIIFNKNNLKDKTFLFPAPNAFAATLLTKFELKKNFNFDIDKEGHVLYVNSHDSVYKGISRDIGYLGGGIIRTYNNFKSKADKENIHIVYKTDAYPSHPIVAHPRVDEKTLKKIQMAFLKMPDDIKKLLSIKSFIITENKEFEVIKNIGVK